MKRTVGKNRWSSFGHSGQLILALLFAAGSMACPARAEEDSTLVPIDSTEVPAVDLLYQGRAIDQDEAVSLRKKGVDLSTLDPVANDMWGSAPGGDPMPMPPEGATLAYDSALAGFGHEISIHRVTRGNLAYRLDVSTVPHRALLTRALLDRLGYNQYAPKRYAQLKLRFGSLDDRQAFLDAVSLDTIKDPASWVKEMPDNRPELTLQDVVLEPGRVEIQNYYWSALPSDFSEGRRALRALLVPLSLCDAPENIDSYKWDFDRVLNNALLVPYPREIESQRPFDTATIDDLRWIARRIAPLTVADWTAIVDAASYPPDIAAIVLQKIIAKRNQMLASMKIDAAPLPYDVHFSNDSVKNGQVIQSHFDGYASRFTYGDAEDPLRFSEMKDLGVMETISSAMQTLSSQLNQKMVVAAPGKYLPAHMEQVVHDFLTHQMNNPNEPYTQPISTWGGPVGGFNLTASRQLTTGTFYGSNAAIQLVDTVGFSGTAGYFRGIDGVKNMIPGLQASVTFSRNYTHLRSLPSISEAFNVPTTDFIIPYLLHDLSKILANPKSLQKSPEQPVSVEQKAQDLGDYTRAVEDLLSRIKDGEMFTVTDTLTGGANLQIQVPTQAFFPSAPMGYNESLNFGAGTQGVIVHRTTLRRVHDDLSGDNYLQIYTQSLDAVTGNMTLDFNYWINVAHFGIEKSKGIARTRVYTLKSDPNRPQETAKVIANSVRSLLKWNSDSDLESNYPYYLLNHDLSEDNFQFRLLLWQWKDLEERHRLRIQPPKDPDHAFDPSDFERTLYSYRQLKLSGSNYLSFISNIVDAASKGKYDLATTGGDNPAYTPWGHAHWTELYSDAELTAGHAYTPVTMQRETWGGWAISQDKLFEIFNELDSKLADLKSAGVSISPIHRDIFATTDKLEFYNVTATTIFYPIGMERIIGALEPAADPHYQPHGFVERWTRDASSAGDMPVFNSLVSWLGGEKAYQEMCEDEHTSNGGADRSPTDNYSSVFKGNTYGCMTSWAHRVLEYRRTRPADNADSREAMLEWQTQLLTLLEEKIPVSQLMKVAQKDGFYFQVRVNGFRKGDHQAKDSEAREIIASYVSDSVGTADQYAGAGAFADLADKTHITPYEVNALFFTGGN